jgi:hypothetical protein
VVRRSLPESSAKMSSIVVVDLVLGEAEVDEGAVPGVSEGHGRQRLSL